MREKSGGRKAGTPNLVTKELKMMILEALDNCGGIKYLEEQARSSPAQFMTLLGKVLPMQVTGKDGKDFIPERIDIRFINAATAS